MFEGGFLPILKGKKTSKLRPEFVIFDPTKGEKLFLLVENENANKLLCFF